jgi:hypothetical protein
MSSIHIEGLFFVLLFIWLSIAGVWKTIELLF